MKVVSFLFSRRAEACSFVPRPRITAPNKDTPPPIKAKANQPLASPTPPLASLEKNNTIGITITVTS